jgi:hypothetical protein
MHEAKLLDLLANGLNPSEAAEQLRLKGRKRGNISNAFQKI